MAQEIAELTTLFADVSGSTQLYEKIGDAQARTELAKCLALLTECIHGYGGTVIKTIGDEVMCTLPGADAGIEAACAMQQTISDTYEYSAAPLAIRIGFHAGQVIKENGDVFGDAVNVAARMAGMAKSGQIITTKETSDLLSPANRDKTRVIARTMVKGKQEPMEICEVIWQEQDLTVMPGAFYDAAKPEASARLVLEYMGKEMVLGEEMSSVMIGRGAQNGLVVASPLASRVHAKIEYRNGKFMLGDQSTNGTFLSGDDGTKLVLHREESPLTGSGKIGLGQTVEKDEAGAVVYRCG